MVPNYEKTGGIMTYYGRNGSRYILDTRLGGGGEGEVYSVSGRGNLVAKLYFDKKFIPTPNNPNPRQLYARKDRNYARSAG